MIDTLVFLMACHTIEPGQEQDITETSTVSTYLMDNSINGTLLLLLDKDKNVTLMEFKLLPIHMITLISIGKISSELDTLKMLVVISKDKSKMLNTSTGLVQTQDGILLPIN